MRPTSAHPAFRCDGRARRTRSPAPWPTCSPRMRPTPRAQTSGSPEATDAAPELVSSRLAETGLREGGDGVDRLATVGVVARDGDGGAPGEPERHDAEQALRVRAVDG